MAHLHSLVGERELSWKAVFWSGLAAGIVFMMLEMIMVAVFQGKSMWAPPRMIAAMILGRNVLPPPATFAVGVMMTALIFHMILSWIYAAAFGGVFGGMQIGSGIAVGALVGLGIYLVNFYGFTAIWPWFAEARGWISLVAHVAFGLVLSWTYIGVARRAQ